MDETCKSYILQYCGNMFRSYRNKMKAKYRDFYNTDDVKPKKFKFSKKW